MSTLRINPVGRLVEVIVNNGKSVIVTPTNVQINKVSDTEVIFHPFSGQTLELSDIFIDGQNPSDYDDLKTKVAAVFPKANSGNGGSGFSGDYNDLTNKPNIEEMISEGTTGLLDDRGNWDASGNTFPDSGGSGDGGAIMKGDIWFITGQGVLNGKNVKEGDSIRALDNNPNSDQWAILQTESEPEIPTLGEVMDRGQDAEGLRILNLGDARTIYPFNTWDQRSDGDAMNKESSQKLIDNSLVDSFGYINSNNFNDSSYILGDGWSVVDGKLAYVDTPTGRVLEAEISDTPGSGYSVDDELTLDGGNSDATIKVTGVDGGGAITGFDILTEGTGYSNNTSYGVTYGGAGVDAIINVTKVSDKSVYLVGGSVGLMKQFGLLIVNFSDFIDDGGNGGSLDIKFGGGDTVIISNFFIKRIVGEWRTALFTLSITPNNFVGSIPIFLVSRVRNNSLTQLFTQRKLFQILQNGTSVPSASDLGDFSVNGIVWTREDVGVYHGTKTDWLINSVIFINPQYIVVLNTDGSIIGYVRIAKISGDLLEILTFDNTPVAADSIMAGGVNFEIAMI